ncbi:MAG: REP-associated tyrosine transposase [Candidatus Acidiferrales bacterium]
MLPDHIPIQRKRRRLPHWSLPGATYFVTFRMHARPLDPQEIAMVKGHVVSGHGRYYHLCAVQVMPDHAHLLVRPRQQFTLSRILKGIKGVTARKLNQERGGRGSLWQDESFDRLIRNERELRETLDYMFRNPVTRGLTEDPEIYVGWFLNREEE